eukprot:11999959-Karenia_brevis.AAC.1
MLPFLTAPLAIQAFNGLLEHLGSLFADAMPDLSCHASPVHLDDFADISQCGPLPQLVPQHYTNIVGQSNTGSDWFAPGTWEVKMTEDEALWTQHDIATAQATAA